MVWREKAQLGTCDPVRTHCNVILCSSSEPECDLLSSPVGFMTASGQTEPPIPELLLSTLPLLPVR